MLNKSSEPIVVRPLADNKVSLRPVRAVLWAIAYAFGKAGNLIGFRVGGKKGGA